MTQRRPVAWLILTLLATLTVGTVSALAAEYGGHTEYPGNPHNLPSYSYANYRQIAGRGPNLTDHKPVVVSCRVKGKAVSDGDVWWYRLASKPWNNRYYVSADDFYNDGRDSGSLKGTPYFDPKVPVC